MGKTVYSRQPRLPKTAVKTSGKDLRTSFKNTFETANAVKGMELLRAIEYLHAVIAHERCIPFRRFNKSMGRCSQAKEFKTDKGRWPEKSCKVVLGLLQNLEANAQVKNLEVEKLIINHVQVNKAQYRKRRTYRAHGRIAPYKAMPCHVEMWACVDQGPVRKENERQKQMSRKQLARRPRRNLQEGGD